MRAHERKSMIGNRDGVDDVDEDVDIEVEVEVVAAEGASKNGGGGGALNVAGIWKGENSWAKEI